MIAAFLIVIGSFVFAALLFYFVLTITEKGRDE